MHALKRILFVFTILFSGITLVHAANFAWLEDLQIKASANPDRFIAELAARFKIGKAEVDVVLSNVKRPADAYMVLRLGEISHHSTHEVLEQYRAQRSKGWGRLAQSLGIKPGSREFHALKRGHDIYHEHSHDHDSHGHPGKGKGKNKGKGKGREH